jgi:hypothetical protein
MVWYKANSKELFGLDYSPFIWWLSVGLIIEFCYLNAWWLLSKSIQPWSAYLMLSVAGSLTHMTLMSIYYGFALKYIVGFCFIMLGVAITKM